MDEATPKREKRVKKRWFIMLIFVLLFTVLYFHGREVHISENIGERDVDIF